MKIASMAVMAAVFFAAQIQAQSLPNAPYVVVRGHAERSLAPDRFEINITVQSESSGTDLIRRHSSIPEIPPMLTSEITRSGRHRLAISKALSPLSANLSAPMPSSALHSSRTVTAASSTTRIDSPPSVVGSVTFPGGCGCCVSPSLSVRIWKMRQPGSFLRLDSRRLGCWTRLLFWPVPRMWI